MPIEPDPMVERLRTQLRALEAWIADLTAENAALRQRLALAATEPPLREQTKALKAA